MSVFVKAETADYFLDTELPPHLSKEKKTTHSPVGLVQEAEDELAQKVFWGASGKFRDCYEERRAIASGQFAAICDRSSMKAAMSWDFR